MGSLTGTNISTSYTSLLRVDDNTSGVDGAIEHITDGEGNATPLDISTTKFRVYPSVNANDTFNVTNATGETALVVNTSNKLVGIGGAPSADRHLEIHSAGNTYLQITSPSGDFNSALLFKHDSAQKGVLGWNDGQSALKLVYGTNIDNNTGIAIDTAGKVGIGTETPDYLLDVETTTSTARINSTGNTNAGLILKNTACEWFNYIAPTSGNWKLKDDTSDVTPITLKLKIILPPAIESLTFLPTGESSGNNCSEIVCPSTIFRAFFSTSSSSINLPSDKFKPLIIEYIDSVPTT